MANIIGSSELSEFCEMMPETYYDQHARILTAIWYGHFRWCLPTWTIKSEAKKHRGHCSKGTHISGLLGRAYWRYCAWWTVLELSFWGIFFAIKSLMEGNEQWSKARLVRLYVIILLNHIAIMVKQYKDPYQPTSISYFMSLVITAMFDPSLVFSSKTRSELIGGWTNPFR